MGTFASAHFLIHTDLGPREAQDLLSQLEVMQRLLAAYWGRPAQGVIECIVVKDLAAWPAEVVGTFDPNGLAKIEGGAGLCVSQVRSQGNQFLAKATVYAVAAPGVVRHESVHAYCTQTFGRTGAQWYAEGMAELGQYWVEDNKAVHAPPAVIRYLRETPPRPLAELIVADEKTGGTWQDYAWWWSLCHLLEYNPNYSAQFRMLGAAILAGRDGVGFEQVFGDRMNELSFEHRFFIDHLQVGFRADLCAWDWTRKFFPASTRGRTATATIQAARGWQPTGLAVVPHIEYSYRATGSWKTSKEGDAVDADGTEGGEGRLVGVVMRDYKLGEPFELSQSGTFAHDEPGNLYVRCQDDWAKLNDNSGRMSLKISLAR